MKSVKLLIFGQVQGVGFRYWVRGKMRELGVDGDVWNNDDG
ncbi:acylphosphatase, partial [Candidatus Beckwithbacteria bacterium CG23_combo_of_CG06-09_8_20_14_all_47_9]